MQHGLFERFSSSIIITMGATLLLHSLCQTGIPHQKIKAIHVHHGLLPEAEQWTQYCQQLCRQCDVELKIKRLNSKPAHGESIEAWARQQRYAVFTTLMKPNDILLTAHHLDDQAETVLLNLFRGAGPHGLSSIALKRPLGKGQLLRPFLAG